MTSPRSNPAGGGFALQRRADTGMYGGGRDRLRERPPAAHERSGAARRAARRA